MELTTENLQHLATLSALKIDESEVADLRSSLAAILSHVSELDSVDTKSVEATTSNLLAPAPLREDAVLPSLSNEDALRAAPRAAEGGFLVPGFVEG